MDVDAYDLSVGLFIRGLNNLKGQLAKAEAYVTAGGIGEATLLDARLPGTGRGSVASPSPRDLHLYTFADQVHWAAEGAKLAIARLRGAPIAPVGNDARSLAALQYRIDAAVMNLRDVERSDLEAGLDREIVIEHPSGTTRSPGRQFLVAYAIPHFFYHLSAAYGILRNEGVQLTMGDFLGNWGAT